MANFGNVQNLPFAFFLPPLSAVVYAVLAYRRFDKLSDRRKSIQSSGHKKDIPFLKILVTCKICHLPFFCPSVSSCLCSFGLRCFDKPSDRRKSIQSSGHKKDIPFLKILVTCKISKRGCPSYTYKYVFLLSKR